VAVVYIGLGSNLADPRAQVEQGIGELAALDGARLLACSALYASAPVGPPGQPDYVNAVVALESRRSPADLLAALQGIERRHGRRRDGARWGPRTLDLDILLYGRLETVVPGLVLPHPQIRHRAFVLVPLADIAPLDLPVPGQGVLGELLRVCPMQGVARLADAPATLGVRPASPLSCC
jgi:2-amino-4-hydroxy-6-hydroxymethyldihydropteridine diphosphokinase